MDTSLQQFMDENKAILETSMSYYLNMLDIPPHLRNSMQYSVEAGGKRIRPLLLLASFLNYNNNKSKALSSAAALEFIHTYSLIHDDLPAMDNDDLRRGKPTNHIQFDEATAVLAGDALLTYSFQLITDDDELSNDEKIYLVNLLSESSGPKGMISGQMLDIEAENKNVDLESLEAIHTHKTGALIRFAVLAGAYLGHANQEQISHLDTFSFYMGLIFQVQDDILDITGDKEKIGKPTESDTENSKSTYPGLCGVDGAIEKKQTYVQLAQSALKQANASHSYLWQLVNYLSERDH